MTTAAPKVLIVEDEAPMRRFLRTTLIGQGYEILEAGDGADALDSAARAQPNLILLDLGLPDVDGMEVVARLRQKSAVPIIVLSARDFEYAKIEALDLGANDYVTKPFATGELLARVRAALRLGAGNESPAAAVPLRLGELSVDLEARVVKLDEEEVHLTPTEFALLSVLVRRLGRVVSHRELLREVWGRDAAGQVEYLRVFMRQLRYKLEREPSQPRHLVTIPGVGYRLIGET